MQVREFRLEREGWRGLYWRVEGKMHAEQAARDRTENLYFRESGNFTWQGCILFTRDSITAAYGFWEILILPMRLNSITAKLAGMAWNTLSRGH